MKEESVNEFNKWHNSQVVDINIDTPWHKFALQEISKLDLENRRIFEIGCGRGGFAINVARMYEKLYSCYVAADFSDSAIEIGKSYAAQDGISSIEWKTEDIMNISFPDNSFDVVISCETIEHVPYPQKAINELYRVTKPEGVLILTTPNYENFIGLYRIYLRLSGRQFTEVGQPINKFVMYDRTLRWLNNIGYQILFSDSCNILYPSFFKKSTITLNWDYPKFITKKLGINSFFLAKKKL